MLKKCTIFLNISWMLWLRTEANADRIGFYYDLLTVPKRLAGKVSHVPLSSARPIWFSIKDSRTWKAVHNGSIWWLLNYISQWPCLLYRVNIFLNELLSAQRNGNIPRLLFSARFYRMAIFNLFLTPALRSSSKARRGLCIQSPDGFPSRQLMRPNLFRRTSGAFRPFSGPLVQLAFVDRFHMCKLCFRNFYNSPVNHTKAINTMLQVRGWG